MAWVREDYAREELRAEIGAMMAGEQLGVGHKPRRGTAYVSSWIKALENDPRETRAAAVDVQRISDWLVARERHRSMADGKAEHDRPVAGAGHTREQDDLERPSPFSHEAGDHPSLRPARRDRALEKLPRVPSAQRSGTILDGIVPTLAWVAGGSGPSVERDNERRDELDPGVGYHGLRASFG